MLCSLLQTLIVPKVMNLHWGTFKYHMSLQGGGGCSNRQNTITWGGDLAKSSFKFYSGWKSLIHSSSCSIFVRCGGRRLVENVIREEGLADNVKILSYGGRKSIISQKTVIWYLNVSLVGIYIFHVVFFHVVELYLVMQSSNFVWRSKYFENLIILYV